MTYLLDTHYLLWAVADSKKISPNIKKIMQDRKNEIMVSVVSFWEVSLKVALGKLEINGFEPNELPNICLKIGFEIRSLLSEDASTYYQLTAKYHKDPFDRMLIWQAIHNDYTLISKDAAIKQYRSIGLSLISP